MPSLSSSSGIKKILDMRINCKIVQIINRNSVATILCDNDKDNSKQIEPSDDHKKDIERIYEGIIDI